MRSVRLISGLLGIVAVAGCAAQTAKAVERTGTAREVPVVDARPYGKADLEFGLRLLTAWCAADSRKNIVFSPSSLASGLGMAFLGAKGKTAAEMAKVLGVSATDPLPGLKARAQVLKGLPGLKTSDRLWIDETKRTDQSFLDAVATAYGAGVKVLPIMSDPAGASRTINKTISDDTKGMIKDLIPPDALGRVGWVMTDATYLKAEWRNRFDASDTSDGEFTTGSGQRPRVPFLHADGSYGYAARDGWTSVTLPYKGDRLEAVALLPDGKGGGCPDLKPGVLASHDALRKPESIALGLPKLDLSTKETLNDLLAGLGMPTAFADDADFSGISPEAWKIANVRHAAAMRVDEKGTEAAAATSVEMEALAARPPEAKLDFDRPFVLVIRDTKSGEPLFMARIADASQK